MKNMYLIFVVMSLIIVINVCGQENQFTVIAKSGDVYLIDYEDNKTKEIHVGDNLVSHHRLNIGDQSYFSIVDTNLQTLEITKKGNYSLFQIDSLLTNKSNSVTKNFTQLILSGMSSHKNKYKEMKTLGAVVRSSLDKIDIAVPDSNNINYSEYNFSWYPTQNKTKYLFKLLNPENKTLFMSQVNDTSITLDLTKFTLQYGVYYKWIVQYWETQDRLEADSTLFTIITPSQKKQIIKQLNNIENDFIKDSSAFNNFVIAKFLRSNRLFDDASLYYKKAIELVPNVNFYWYEYLQFLIDVGLRKKAMNDWMNSTFNKPNLAMPEITNDK
ncbi:MAG: hypothetical protein GY936_13340 [Ignavibacteriae bacterium]|nr:hypothetical protein [Ignavibacteriota bacterium]